jgi:hypothetical protein
MSYRVIKTIRGRRYLYEQRSWREGGRVRTQSRSLGPLDPPQQRPKGLLRKIDALISANRLSPEERAIASGEREAERIAAYQRQVFGETAEERAVRERQAGLDKLHALYGLRIDERSKPAAPAVAKSDERDAEPAGPNKDAVQRGSDEATPVIAEQPSSAEQPSEVSIGDSAQSSATAE